MFIDNLLIISQYVVHSLFFLPHASSSTKSKLTLEVYYPADLHVAVLPVTLPRSVPKQEGPLVGQGYTSVLIDSTGIWQYINYKGKLHFQTCTYDTNETENIVKIQ